MDYTKSELALAGQMVQLSKADYPYKIVSRKQVDTCYIPADPPTKKDSIEIKDSFTYFRRLDTLGGKEQ